MHAQSSVTLITRTALTLYTMETQAVGCRASNNLMEVSLLVELSMQYPYICGI